jgi:hypothetical protein
MDFGNRKWEAAERKWFHLLLYVFYYFCKSFDTVKSFNLFSTVEIAVFNLCKASYSASFFLRGLQTTGASWALHTPNF